jgi:hypothetical protein
MTLVLVGQAREKLGGTPVNEFCYYCYSKIAPEQEDIIHWLGEGGRELFLHPPCATDLCLRILRDVHEHQCVSGEEFGGGPQ